MSRRDQALFWDTPILALRVCGRRTEKAQIEELADKQQAVTSRYVIQQFRSTFLRSAILLHSLLKTYDKNEVRRRLDQYPITPREGVRARQIWVALDEDTVGDQEDKLSRLERWIEWEFIDCATDQVRIQDNTECCLCDEEVVRDENGVYSLRRVCNLDNPKPCVIEAFWDDRSEELSAVAGSTEKTIHSIVEAAQKARADPRKVRGRQCWAPLSDAVIAAQSPTGSEVQTTNLKDFVPLTHVIGGGRSARNPIK